MGNLVIHTPLSCFIQDKNFFFFLVIFKWQLNEHTMYVFAFIVCHRVTTMWGGHCNTIALSYFKWLFDFCYQWIHVQKCYQNLVITLAAVFCDRSLNESPLFFFQCDKQLKTVRAEKNLMKQRANLKGKSQ